MRFLLSFSFFVFHLYSWAHAALPNKSSGIDLCEDLQEVKAYNNYLHFINESTHGMLIVVKLLENFNLDINKYVDLASYQINQYSNKDLPFDLFEDKDHFFYDMSPYEWYDKAISEGVTLSNNNALKAIATGMKSKLVRINQLRFDLEKLIKDKDLTNKDELNKVYQKLEEGVQLFEEFYQDQKKLEGLIYANASKVESVPSEYTELVSIFDEEYASVRSMLILIRNKEEDNSKQFSSRQSNAYQRLSTYALPQNGRTTSSKFKFNWSNLMAAIKDFDKVSKDYINDRTVNEQYQIYGSYYYYYNTYGLSKFNRYGIGVVSGLNGAIEQLGLQKLIYTELPHYFKVIYPKKLETIDYIESQEVIKSIPSKVKERFVATTDKKIRVLDDVVEFLFYDHMIQDGDIVSVNFNGEWIMEKEELELAPKTFKLKLNKQGRNYLMLHADNVGSRPPNTIGISYMMGGTKKEITLSSDFEKSELIEIEIIE